MVIASLTVTPLGTKTPSLSRYVAECARVLDESGIKHTLTPMGSVLEGPLDEILEVHIKGGGRVDRLMLQPSDGP